MSKPRLIVFDYMRILSLVLIVLYHITGFINLNDTYKPYFSGLGGIGVIILIFISGAVIEYQYGETIGKTFNYKSFIEKRIVRIYPLVCVTMLLTFIIALHTGYAGYTEFNALNFVVEISGLYAQLHQLIPSIFTIPFYGNVPATGIINPPLWFVGTIMVLYLVYPLLSKAINDWGFYVLPVIFMVSYLSDPTYSYMSPISHAFEFVLGVFIVKRGYLITTIAKSSMVTLLSDICFTVYLLNNGLLFIIVSIQLPTTLPYVTRLVIAIMIYCVILVAASYLALKSEPFLKRITYLLSETVGEKLWNYRGKNY